jgi:hypothetical protein
MSLSKGIHAEGNHALEVFQVRYVADSCRQTGALAAELAVILPLGTTLRCKAPHHYQRCQRW